MLQITNQQQQMIQMHLAIQNQSIILNIHDGTL